MADQAYDHAKDGAGIKPGEGARRLALALLEIAGRLRHPAPAAPSRSGLWAREAVPPPTLLALAIQHAMLALTYLIYPLIAASVAGFSDVQLETLLSVSALCMGIATIVQCARSRFGSGLLIVHIPSPGAIPLAQQAFLLGGAGMVAMSTLILGVSQLFAARLIRPLQILLPPEVCGVAVTCSVSRWPMRG